MVLPGLLSLLLTCRLLACHLANRRAQHQLQHVDGQSSQEKEKRSRGSRNPTGTPVQAETGKEQPRAADCLAQAGKTSSEHARMEEPGPGRGREDAGPPAPAAGISYARPLPAPHRAPPEPASIPPGPGSAPRRRMAADGPQRRPARLRHPHLPRRKRGGHPGTRR